MTSFISFARRQNHDHSVDSICARCYQTIASSDNPMDLNAFEETHQCDPNGEFNQSHIYTSLQKAS